LPKPKCYNQTRPCVTPNQDLLRPKQIYYPTQNIYHFNNYSHQTSISIVLQTLDQNYIVLPLLQFV